MKYSILIRVYVLLMILAIVLPMSYFYLVIALIIITLIFISIVVWGVINISSQLFVKTISSFDKTNGEIVLSFDDGPDYENTPAILELLKKYNAKATFFIIGSKAEKNKELVKQIHNEGHLIGNHSYYHKRSFPIQRLNKIKSEISKTQDLIKEITSEDCKYFRPPFGVTNPLLARALSAFDFVVVGWNIRSLDTVKAKEIALANVVDNLKSGDIILLHDTTKDILWILDNILKEIQEKGLKSVRFDSLLSKN